MLESLSLNSSLITLCPIYLWEHSLSPSPSFRLSLSLHNILWTVESKLKTRTCDCVRTRTPSYIATVPWPKSGLFTLIQCLSLDCRPPRTSSPGASEHICALGQVLVLLQVLQFSVPSAALEGLPHFSSCFMTDIFNSTGELLCRKSLTLGLMFPHDYIQFMYTSAEILICSVYWWY